ncbi:MAG: MFS transporter [Bacteroidota bacterium]|nr:MFS transporter [Bacteroidota bacterium]
MTPKADSSWKFPAAFWTANVVELFERAAYYAVFIAITLYLTQVVGFNDIWAAWISGFFSAGLYFLPPFSGAFADKIGFRNSIILAFSLLTVGYFTLGLLPYKVIVIPALIVLMFGGSFIKSIITGTVAKTSNNINRARAYSIFYGIVNVGAFTGKTVAYPLRINLGLESINYYAATMTLIALVLVLFFYRNVETAQKRTFSEVWASFIKVATNGKLLVLILIVSGFWIIQQQLYATMPKYVLRMVGKNASPEWIANVNPFVVMVFVVIITNFMSKVKAINSMIIGMFLMPLSALAMFLSSFVAGNTVGNISFFGIFSLHPITVMLIVGVAIQGVAESFISPRYLEYFSKQAPKGQEGLYLGFSHLHSFISSILGFGISGYLLTEYCPDPKYLTETQKITAYSHAHYIWIYFLAIGVTSGIALFIYSKINRE